MLRENLDLLVVFDFSGRNSCDMGDSGVQIPLNGMDDDHGEQKEVTVLVTGYGVRRTFL